MPLAKPETGPLAGVPVVAGVRSKLAAQDVTPAADGASGDFWANLSRGANLVPLDAAAEATARALLQKSGRGKLPV